MDIFIFFKRSYNKITSFGEKLIHFDVVYRYFTLHNGRSSDPKVPINGSRFLEFIKVVLHGPHGGNISKTCVEALCFAQILLCLADAYSRSS